MFPSNFKILDLSLVKGKYTVMQQFLLGELQEFLKHAVTD